MSIVENETPAEADAPVAPVTIETVDLSKTDDESRVSDEPQFRALLSEWQDAAKAAVRETNRYTNAVKALAALRVHARSFLIRKDQFPDWAGAGDLAKRTTGIAEAAIKANLSQDAATRLDQNVRAHIKRTYMLPEVIGYIVTHEDGHEDMRAAWESGDEGVTKVMTEPTEALKRAVRKHYKAATLNVPDGPFQVGETDGSPVGEKTKETALSALRKGVEGMEDVTAHYAITVLLEGLSKVSAALVNGKINEVENRKQVVSQLERISVIGDLTARAISGVKGAFGEDEDAALAGAYFDPKTDATK